MNTTPTSTNTAATEFISATATDAVTVEQLADQFTPDTGVSEIVVAAIHHKLRAADVLIQVMANHGLVVPQ